MNRFLNTAVSMALLVIYTGPAFADTVLLGDNAPFPNVNDGDFNHIKLNKFKFGDSPCWTAENVKGHGDKKVGVSVGAMTSGNRSCRIESRVLNNIPAYPKLIAGDVLKWSYSADTRFPGEARISLQLVFGDRVRVLADNQVLKGGYGVTKTFTGTYAITDEDAASGMPFVRIIPSSQDGSTIWIDSVNLRVVDPTTSGPEALKAESTKKGIKLTWQDSQQENRTHYSIYRGSDSHSRFSRTPVIVYKEIANSVSGQEYVDSTMANGKEFFYVVTRSGSDGEHASPAIRHRRLDSESPQACNVKAHGKDASVALEWTCDSNDVESYSVFRGDTDGNNLREIASGLTKTRHIDYSTVKNAMNTYVVQAIDFSGNKSEFSTPVEATAKTVLGASFRDFILPMPIHKKLRSDVWGADNVIPRDPDNGIEHPDWCYWGGHPIKGSDGKYHMLVARWPENSVQGHWRWWDSTVQHTIADKPTGPYVPTGDVAYSWKKGKGHNPDITPLNDGTFMLHLLGGDVLTGPTLRGPWKFEGNIEVDFNGLKAKDENPHQYRANLAGVQREDGSLLFLTKWARVMISTNGVLGPYKVMRKEVKNTPTIPPELRKMPLEDPTLWRDEVQYHMLINGFIDKKAIYLRSADGLDWKFDPGVAFDPDITRYEDGTITAWDKLERPHVIQDDYGRATHISLAVLDVPKDDERMSDNHSSKNIIIPMVVHKRLTMLNKEPVDASTEEIKVLIRSEEGFDAQSDLDLKSLRFGASEEVNFGRGSRIASTEPHDDGLILVFDGAGNGITEKNFVGKLIGKTNGGELVVGFSKLAK